KQRIVEALDLEDTAHNQCAPSRFRDRRACFLQLAAFRFNLFCLAAGSEPKKVHLAESEPTQSQEFYMSARNGDKSRFHRVRKQKIARRKRIQELLERPANAACRSVRSHDSRAN